MRSYVKQKVYQAHSRLQSASGQINSPETGAWGTATYQTSDKGRDFVVSGALGMKKGNLVRKRLTNRKRGPMMSMAARKMPRGKLEKACICPKRMTGVFAENERLFCCDCTGYCVE